MFIFLGADSDAAAAAIDASLEARFFLGGGRAAGAADPVPLEPAVLVAAASGIMFAVVDGPSSPALSVLSSLLAPPPPPPNLFCLCKNATASGWSAGKRSSLTTSSPANLNFCVTLTISLDPDGAESGTAAVLSVLSPEEVAVDPWNASHAA